MEERTGKLNFAVPGVNDEDQEWSFNSAKGFKDIVKRHREVLPDDDTPVSWCRYDDIDMEFGNFKELIDEFV